MMNSPTLMNRPRDPLVPRSGEPGVEESEDDVDLPQCKIKRNYTCTHCTYYTQNPRSYLYHLKDEHGEKIRVYECPSCLYASKHSQKLQRHVHMVHVVGKGAVKRRKSEVTKAKVIAEGAKVEKKTSGELKIADDGENQEVKMSAGDVQECSVCSFSSSNPNEVLKHERTAHLKKKFYRCSKCNYVTHMKARYTKHVKYHSMPMIKCDLCDFRTPYKWNLDRHYKNHTGDGAYRCALCNFTADIKQSLTVHEMNHHVPPVGQPAAGGGAGAARRRNKVGASDSTAMEDEIDQEELELLRMEREDVPPYQQQLGTDPTSGVTIGNKSIITGGSLTITPNNRLNTSGTALNHTVTRRQPKIKVTVRKIKAPSTQEQNERHNFQTDFIHPDDIIHHRNGNVYVKNLKCRMCNFKAAWEGEMARHENKVHGMHRPVVVKQPAKKVPRPIPNLIPIQNRGGPPGSSSLPILRIPTVKNRGPTSLVKPQQMQESVPESGLSERDLNEICAKSCPNSSLKDFASLIGGEDAFKMPDDEENNEIPKKFSPKPQEVEDEFDEEETAMNNGLQEPKISSSATDVTFKKKNASFFDKLKEKLLVGAGESCNLVCTWCGHESKCLSELARHQKLHTGSGNRGNVGNGNSGSMISSGAELSSTRCQHCRQRCKTSADLLIHLQSCSEANKNNAASPVPSSDTASNKDEKIHGDEDEEEEEECKEEEEKIKEEEPHPMENKVFVWNNLPQPVETESEEDRHSQSQLPLIQSEHQQQQSSSSPPLRQNQEQLLDNQHEQLQQKQATPPPPLQQIILTQQQDEDSRGTSVRSKSPISEGSLVGIETAPGYGAVTSKLSSEAPEGLPANVDTKSALSVKKVFKCPHCSFWASTASRFHVHIVGHLNKKPFECSLCAYRSNWRWDITKHIRLKSARDAGHERARVLMTDETGRRNYSKYNKYLTMMRVHEPTAESSGSGRRTKGSEPTQGTAVHTSANILQQQPLPAPPRLTRAPNPATSNVSHLGPGAPMRPPPPLRAAHNMVLPGPPPLQPQPGALLQKQQMQLQQQLQQHENLSMKSKQSLKRPATADQENKVDGPPPAKRPSTESKKTLWKCKKCNYRDASRELVLAHVKEHYQQRLQQSASGGGVGNNDSAERHCRLKHSGDVRVVIGLKEGGTMEERFMIDDGNSEAELTSAPPEKTEEPEGTTACDKCPYTTDSANEMASHKEQHVSRPGAIFKCYFCPFYVSLKRDLLQHMALHGVSEPEDYISKTMQQGKVPQKTTPVKSENKPEEHTGRQHHNIETSPHKRYKCIGCPYVSNSKSQFLYHKQFHRPRGAPFKCGLCSYNVSRRHLLHQHLRVHGILVPPQKSPSKSADREVEEIREDGDDEIEEVTIVPQRQFIGPPVSESLPDTRRMAQIPLVWVSRAGKFSKMFKCRFCPHVNLRKANIQEHEKMHRVRNINSSQLDSTKDKQSKEQGGSVNQQPHPIQQHRCPDCNYMCNNAGVLSSHAKVHQGLYGQVHCLVDTTRSDEAQLQELNASIHKESGDESVMSLDTKDQELPTQEIMDFQLEISKDSANENVTGENESILANQLNKDAATEDESARLLYFCSNCPARFLFEKELNIHMRFHEIRLAHRCETCSYTARQRPHLLAHLKVHTDEYQERTNALVNMYKISPDYPRPRSAIIVDGYGVTTPLWVVITARGPPESSTKKDGSAPERTSLTPSKTMTKQFACDLCPAKFFKSVALQYHITLHGGSGPHKCRRCDYAVKTYGNLVKHEMIHEDMTPKDHTDTFSAKSKNAGSIPLSGTDLFQQKSEAQKLNSEAYSKKIIAEPPPLHVDPQFGILMHGNPDFIYPTYYKNGRLKEKRYKCHKCPSAFEKREQYKVHLSLHGSRQRYKCEKCDYSVKYYANYIQHMRKHQTNDEAVEARKLEKSGKDGNSVKDERGEAEPLDEASPAEEVATPVATKSVKSIGSSPTSRNGPLQLSMADQQTILLLQQRRSSNASSSRDGGEDRKCFRCPHCPYSSQRRDGVESHLKRHLCVSGVQGTYICSHCDYTVPQLHFLREHNKLHFKTNQADVFMKYDRIELWASEEGKENMSLSTDGHLTNGMESSGKKLIFQDNGGTEQSKDRFIPLLYPPPKEEEKAMDVEEEEKVFIDIRTGEPFNEKNGDEGEGEVPVEDDGDEKNGKETAVFNETEVEMKNGDGNSDAEEVAESANADDTKSESGSSSSSSSSSSNSSSSSDSSSNSSSNSSNSSSNSTSSCSSSSSSGDSDSDDSDENMHEVKSVDENASTSSEN